MTGLLLGDVVRILVRHLGEARGIAVPAGDHVVRALAVVLRQRARLHAEVGRLGVVGDDRQRRLLGLGREAGGELMPICCRSSSSSTFSCSDWSGTAG